LDGKSFDDSVNFDLDVNQLALTANFTDGSQSPYIATHVSDASVLFLMGASLFGLGIFSRKFKTS
jgi:glyoxylate utilization-related uncharacterized protein